MKSLIIHGLKLNFRMTFPCFRMQLLEKLSFGTSRQFGIRKKESKKKVDKLKNVLFFKKGKRGNKMQ